MTSCITMAFLVWSGASYEADLVRDEPKVELVKRKQKMRQKQLGLVIRFKRKTEKYYHVKNLSMMIQQKERNVLMRT